MAGREGLYREYWQGFRAYCEREGTTLAPRAAPGRYYFLFPLGVPGIGISLLAAQKWGMVRCELYLDGPLAKERFDALSEERRQIESRLGRLDWPEKPGRAGQHIVSHGPTFDLDERGSWAASYRWMKDEAERSQRVFAPYVRTLGAVVG